MRRTLIVVAVACLALFAVSVATAKGGGNSANAKLCQKDGWMNLVRADGTTFASENECVSYGAQGGAISPPSQPRTGAEVCASLGGFYQAPNTGQLVWVCDGWSITDYDSQFAALEAACRFDLGSNYNVTYTHPETRTEIHADTDCYRLSLA
jgi:hypothetical protein